MGNILTIVIDLKADRLNTFEKYHARKRYTSTAKALMFPDNVFSLSKAVNILRIIFLQIVTVTFNKSFNLTGNYPDS